MKFDKSTTIGDLERAVATELRGPAPADLTFDLSSCSFLELPCLHFLTSIITERSRKGLSTALVLPQTGDVRDFINAWHYPEAVREASGVSWLALTGEPEEALPVLEDAAIRRYRRRNKYDPAPAPLGETNS